MDPSYPMGYQSKYMALLEMKYYKEACATLREMFSKIKSSDDAGMGGNYPLY